MEGLIKRIFGNLAIIGGLSFIECGNNPDIYKEVVELVKKEGINSKEKISYLEFKNKNTDYQLTSFIEQNELELLVSKEGGTEIFSDSDSDGMNDSMDYYFFKDNEGPATICEIKENDESKKISEKYDSLMRNIPELYKESKK